MNLFEQSGSIKLGHQAPRGYVENKFNSIEIRGDFAYCLSDNFVYNIEEEQQKLYNAQPCYYTDERFYDTIHNYYKECFLYWERFESISLKSCIRRVLSCKNIPVGTIVVFKKSSYVEGKKIDLSFNFKVKKENKIKIDYEINYPGYFRNFTNCEFSKNLTNRLRENGFIVSVRKNNSFLLNMINTASQATGSNKQVNTEIDGEVAVAYGYGKKIGFSSFENDFMGYSNGCKNVLFDRFGEFDKWSRCFEIEKTTPIQEIVNSLKEE